jgi:ABC-type multidrug transport system fused ATPase/permease subunit
MFNSIITASMQFFNTNTSGRILNRFSKDLGAIDELLPNAMIDCAQIMLNLVGAAVVVTSVNYYLLIPTFIMCIMFYFLRAYYIRTSRTVKRLEGISESPVFGEYCIAPENFRQESGFRPSERHYSRVVDHPVQRSRGSVDSRVRQVARRPLQRLVHVHRHLQSFRVLARHNLRLLHRNHSVQLSDIL